MLIYMGKKLKLNFKKLRNEIKFKESTSCYGIKRYSNGKGLFRLRLI